MNKIQNLKPLYDLEERTFKFAFNIRKIIKKLPKKLHNIDDFKQLIRSSGSVGANYIEANGALGKKDFLMRLRICRKEAKESTYWLKLIYENNISNQEEIEKLIQESIELTKIFGSIITKSE
jgi:four helix bundle protein